MIIKRLILGPLATNTYYLEIDGEVLIIDPASKSKKLFDLLKDKKVLGVLLTHGHFDHIRGVDEIYKEYHIPILLHGEDVFLATDESLYQENMKIFGVSGKITSPITSIQEGIQKIGSFEFEVYHTPGHTMGSVLYRFNDDLFTGDTLFKEGVGRTDLIGGSNRLLKDSLHFIKSLDPKLIVHPGHDEESTLGHEFMYNIYLRP